MSGSRINITVAGACYIDRIMSPWLECHPRMKPPVPRETSSNFFAGGLPTAGPRHFRKEQDGRASGRLVWHDRLVEYPPKVGKGIPDLPPHFAKMPAGGS